MLGRILRSADFERVLGVPACARSAHFAIHFLAGRPSHPAYRRAAKAKAGEAPLLELSTDDAPSFTQPVDDLPSPAPLRAVADEAQAWLGAVVPKRHARRAVTRNLLKRQIRAALLLRDVPGSVPPLRSGLWVVRLRAPFERVALAGAASATLRAVARGELEAVLGQAERRLATDPLLPGAAVNGNDRTVE